MAVYLVRGEVKGLVPEENTVIVHHEEIPGYMAEMTMPLDVKNAAELEGLQTNDLITFRMIVTETDGWIDQVKKVGRAEPVATDDNTTLPEVPVIKPLAIGDALPDFTFTNELGKSVRLSDYQGKAMAITFIFTRCPFPDFCPRMATQFSEAQEMMKGEEDWQLLAVTIDPEYDTPEVLHEYAKRYGYDPERWSWVTGDREDIENFSGALGLTVARLAGLPDHNLRTAVVDPDGRISQIFIGNFWTADDLVDEVRKAKGEFVEGAETSVSVE